MTHSEYVYEVKIQGLIDRNWSDWLISYSVQFEGDITVICGRLTGQSQLQGIIRQIGNLGLEIISIQQLTDNLSDEDTNEI